MNTKGEYTKRHYDELKNIMERDYEQDYESDEVIAKLNDPDFIRPFYKRLISFYNEVLGENFTADEAKTDLLKRAEKLNISLLKRNTIANWFSGKTEPKYGDDDRHRLFAIAFALELDIKKTERLFHKVFLDKAFNERNEKEFIFLHCFYNNKPFSTAEMLIERLDKIISNDTKNEQTEKTTYLGAASMNINEDDLLDFIANHPHNFSLNNTAAKKHRQDYLDKLTIGDSDKLGLAEQEYERRPEVVEEKGRNPKSIDFLLYMINNIDYIQKSDEITAIRDKFPRKEISNQFPDKHSLSEKDPSSYALRKDIILLYFYFYWVSCFLRRKTGDYNSFVEELNGILFECGFSPLYIGNPYDWLFLYCSACAEPLDRYREFHSESDEDED